MPLPAGVTFLSPTVPVHVFDAERPGPTAIIEAAIHGDEIAGAHALQELLEEEIRPARGRLIIIPVMNAAAYRARQRTRSGGPDLNRCFPGDSGDVEPERRLARRPLDLMIDEQPALVATLHESLKRHHPDIPLSFGQSIVYGTEPMPEVIGPLIAALNEQLEHPYERWAPHYFPVPSSSTEVIVAHAGCVGLCIETWLGFEERRRIDMHRLAVTLLLRHYEIL